MSEGELKKQINYARMMHDSVKLQRKWQIKSTLNGIEASLDEAKEEFPMKLWMEDNHNLTDEEISKLDCERNRQTLNWFKKYFGE